MIRFFCGISILITAIISIFVSTASAQETCVVAGSNLQIAKDNYATRCDIERADCDPFNGEWICASFSMTSPVPPALTVFQTEPVIEAPVIEEPVTVTPVVVEPVVTEPVVTEPVVVATGLCVDSAPVGDGWGWDGTKSCRLPIASVPVGAGPVPGPCVDSAPVGDGWGWDGTKSCRLTIVSEPAIAEPVAAEPVNESTPPAGQPILNSKIAAGITDLILITGQSNVLGAGTAYNPSLDDPSDQVFAFTSDGWQIASLKQIWDRNWFPRNHPNTDPNNNLALHFGKSATARDSSRVIGFIVASNPGADISHWNYQSSFYNAVKSKALDAINQLPHKSEVDGILWHQGESDGEDKQYYSDALYSLISNLRNEPWVNDRAPFICGETKIRAVNNRLNGLNRDSDPTTACVAGEDLSTRGDDRHFDAPALRTLGARYAEAYLNIRP